jgi:O-acetyl-ADP-ribose deacetylase (regulator of RNase III)
MADTLHVGKSTMRLIKGDITDLEINSFVYYAAENLLLGSGYGTAISMRGGPGVQEELKQHGSKEVTEVVVTQAGEMKADYIIHAVGPKFQEEGLPDKLRATIVNALKAAEDKGINAVAFPAMGVGFYGVPLPQSAEITLGTIADYLKGDSKIDDVAVVLMDNREYKPFEQKITAMAGQ